ncbi:MAG: hemolysin family protein [Oscillospiraceae bacterium]|jgi:CBS domain containing-hemolysin-like protein|nr:hemolysin family protein [Oscillospiraceae bacterium]
MYLSIIICVALVVASAFFSAAETAFTSANKIRVKHLAEYDHKSGAQMSLKLLGNYDKLISTLLIGNNIVNLTISSIAAVTAMEYLPKTVADKYGALISTAIVTFVVITFGEILPKTIARVAPEKCCCLFAALVRFLAFILTPPSAFFSLFQKVISLIVSGNVEKASMTEDEVYSLVDEIEAEGVLEENESVLVKSALRFDETSVKEIITPRVNIAAVERTESAEKIFELFTAEQYSRLPVYEGTIDNIIGVLNIKDFIKSANVSNDTKWDTEDVTHPLFVPENKKISEVFRAMQKAKNHLAVVADQYGGTLGIVTLEDIMEELVGEIWDESDTVQEKAGVAKFSVMQKENETVVDVSGQMSKNEFNRRFAKKTGRTDFKLTGDSVTVSGVILEYVGKIPETNDEYEFENFSAEIIAMNGNRVEKIKLHIPEEFVGKKKQDKE